MTNWEPPNASFLVNVSSPQTFTPFKLSRLEKFVVVIYFAFPMILKPPVLHEGLTTSSAVPESATVRNVFCRTLSFSDKECGSEVIEVMEQGLSGHDQPTLE